MALRYQFTIDGRAFNSPLRATWREAAQDAVNDGYAQWVSPDEIRLDSEQGAAIARRVTER